MNSLVVIVFLFVFPTIASSQIPSPPLIRFTKLDLPSTAITPQSTAFDPSGGGPYVGISDGRIVKYNGYTFVDAYITSPNRSSLVCDGTQNNSPAVGILCGKPMDLEFYKLRNEVYIVDAYRGLLVVNVGDKLALPVPTINGNGQPFKLVYGLSVDQLTGDVYFTDASSRFGLSQIAQAVAANDSTGRLLKYNRRTKQVTVLLTNLAGAFGVKLGPDRRYLIFSESFGGRINKLWLSGPKAFKSETILTLNARPDNIQSVPIFGGFWVGVTERSSSGLRVPKPIKIDENGKILQSFDLSKEYPNRILIEFQQRGSQYYVSAVDAGFLGVYN